jgi:flagellar motor switch protein FliM
VANDRVLTHEEIDTALKSVRGKAGDTAQSYDFRRTDRIAKDQLHAIRQLHENFARNTSASLSAYLRAYVAVNLVSVEQLSFGEFTERLPSPTSLVSLGLKPYDGNAALEMNPAVVFPLLEMLLGGTGKAPAKITRELTDIERSILDSLLLILLRDLRAAWSMVAEIEFALQAHENDPQQSQILAQDEAVVAIAFEMRVGELSGRMNLGIPSTVVKMLRQKFDRQGSARRSEATEQDQARMLRLIRTANLNLDVRLRGPSLGTETLLELKEGDVLAFDYPVNRPLDLLVNGHLKYEGEVIGVGRKRAIHIQAIASTGDHEDSSSAPVTPA